MNLVVMVLAQLFIAFLRLIDSIIFFCELVLLSQRYRRKMKGSHSETGKKTINEDELKAFLAAFNRHDLDGIMAFFSDDCTFDMPRGPYPFGQRFVGRSAVREGLGSRFKGIPDVHYSDDRHFISHSGDRGVSEWLLTGTTTSGERIEVRGCDLFDFDRSGKIKRKDSYWKIVQR
jgi:ketosteroid isomerase-like protein